MEDGSNHQAICSECGGELEDRVIQVAIWRDAGFVIIDQVPARVCTACNEQFYEDATASAMRRLVASNFPEEQRSGEVTVPVYRLEQRVRTRAEQASRDDE